MNGRAAIHAATREQRHAIRRRVGKQQRSCGAWVHCRSSSEVPPGSGGELPLGIAQVDRLPTWRSLGLTAKPLGHRAVVAASLPRRPSQRGWFAGFRRTLREAASPRRMRPQWRNPARCRLAWSPVKFIGACWQPARLALGREGPSVQMAAGIAHGIGRIFRRDVGDCLMLLAAGAVPA